MMKLREFGRACQ